MADPGTIQLTKSGVTFITALVMIATLGTKISKIQWIAIIIQVGRRDGHLSQPAS